MIITQLIIYVNYITLFPALPRRAPRAVGRRTSDAAEKIFLEEKGRSFPPTGPP